MARYAVRLSRWTDYGDGIIQLKSFKCRSGHDGFSMHLFDGELEDDQCESYWNHPWVDSGDKPGICIVDDDDFKAIGQPIPVSDPDDHPFGHIHYIWRPCPSDEVAASLARLVAERAAAYGGLVKELFNVKKGASKAFK